MPLLAFMTSSLQVGTKSVTQLATGEKSPSFSYTGATAVACRFYDRSAASLQGQFGVTLNIDAVAIVPYSAVVTPLLTNAADGERMQVQITDTAGVVTTWEVLKVRDLGGMQRIKVLELKRWV